MNFGALPTHEMEKFILSGVEELSLLVLFFIIFFNIIINYINNYVILKNY